MAYPATQDTNTDLPTNYVTGNPYPATAVNKANTAIQALEAKLGISASTPSTVGYVLTVTSAGSTAWQAAPSGGSGSLNGVTVSGTPNAGQALIATSSSAATWVNLTQIAPRVITGSYSTSITPNSATTDIFRVILTASTATINVPSGTPFDGQAIELHTIQDGSGSRTVTWGTGFNFGTSGAPTLTTTANKTDIHGFRYSASSSTWRYYGSGLGF